MMTPKIAAILSGCVLAVAAYQLPFVGAAGDTNWPQWRGPGGSGISTEKNLPIEWSATKNVRWKTPIPGRGHSSPIVWGDLVVLTTAVPAGDGESQDFAVLAYARPDGTLKWRRTVRQSRPHEGTHADGTFASPSVITDGQRLYATDNVGGTVLVIDDVRWDSIGAAGNRIVRTPRLDRLAAEGVRFTRHG